MPKTTKTLSEKQVQSLVSKAADGTYAIGGVEGLCVRFEIKNVPMSSDIH